MDEAAGRGASGAGLITESDLGEFPRQVAGIDLVDFGKEG
jgi:hypothetical protein